MATSRDATVLLHSSREGDRQALDELFALTYDELKRAARFRLGRGRAGETLNTTALVHEIYMRLVDQTRVEWADRAHFLAIASRAMRFVLIDHLRARSALKRGALGELVPIEAIEVEEAGAQTESDLLALNEALERLGSLSPRLGQLVEYRFFGGLTYEEIAEVMGISVRTVKRDWMRARTWLYEMLTEEDEGGRIGPPAGES
ncbi:MAG TPA: sigma-70 family RNA polymerase sigma factor [Longimicrobiales bacterium]|jgi:RNA polymerase sigma factor (TIGR02999 family)